MLTNPTALKQFLDQKVEHYNRPAFIPSDPISIPHRFSLKQDIEIMALFAATLAWGGRKTIIAKCLDLVARMDGAPYQFITGHQAADLRQLTGFVHRTFCDTDLLYFIDFLHRHYLRHTSLEDAFLLGGQFASIETSLIAFEQYFVDSPHFPPRTRKHIPTPARKSACKRLNMLLRWMVRTDNCGVDFGLWHRIPPSALICPIDLHVNRTARQLGLITRTPTDWQTALELTANLRLLDPTDPVKYDFALFGISAEL